MTIQAFSELVNATIGVYPLLFFHAVFLPNIAYTTITCVIRVAWIFNIIQILALGLFLYLLHMAHSYQTTQTCISRDSKGNRLIIAHPPDISDIKEFYVIE